MAGALLEKLKQYSESDYYPLHMPGHKRQISHFDRPFAIDITEIQGFDDLHCAQDLLLEAQRRAAALYGAEETYYLINGSTGGILAAVAAAVPQGGRLLMARNSHRSVYNAVFLNSLRAEYLWPQTDPLRGIAGSISPQEVREMLQEQPAVYAVLVTSPTYDGVVSDIRAIAEETHRAGAVLIVDGAHGAHFGFHPYFPESPLACGADIVVNSLHKTLPSLTQTALLHVQGGRVDRKKLRNYLSIYQSSSPSYVLMAGMDACVDLMARSGPELFDGFVGRLETMRGALGGMRVLHLVDGCERELPAYGFDRSRVLLSLEQCAMNGPELAGILRGTYHLETEMAAAKYVTAILTVADTQEGFERLTKALLEIDAGLQTGAGQRCCGTGRDGAAEQTGEPERPEPRLRNKTVMSIREAQESPSGPVPLWDSAGRVSAGYVYLYPPGIPLLVPGERISRELLEELRRLQSAGLSLRGLEEGSAAVRVVKEEESYGETVLCDGEEFIRQGHDL